MVSISVHFVTAQDTIIKNNGDEIKSKILEIKAEVIRYKEYDFIDGPIKNISVSDVSTVVFENGERKVFSTGKVKKTDYNGNYVKAGMGLGISYGGLGFIVQRRVGGIQGVGAHIGLGFYPYAPFLASAGVKYFPYKDLYVDVQFGLTGVEDPESISRNILYGPSLLAGSDWTWGKETGIGANLALGLTYSINLENRKLYSPFTLAFDIGIIVRF